jgi:hypothetical protein
METFEKAKTLLAIGFYIGPRDPQRNSAFEGKFMVCEDSSEGPSEDASTTGYCVVGDNLDVLVDEAHRCCVFD